MLRGRVECLPGDDVKRPAAGVRQTLTFGQIRLTTPQSFLGALALSQIEHESDALGLVFVEAHGTEQDGHAGAVFAEVLFLDRC